MTNNIIIFKELTSDSRTLNKCKWIYKYNFPLQEVWKEQGRINEEELGGVLRILLYRWILEASLKEEWKLSVLRKQ